MIQALKSATSTILMMTSKRVLENKSQKPKQHTNSGVSNMEGRRRMAASPLNTKLRLIPLKYASPYAPKSAKTPCTQPMVVLGAQRYVHKRIVKTHTKRRASHCDLARSRRVKHRLRVCFLKHGRHTFHQRYYQHLRSTLSPSPHLVSI